MKSASVSISNPVRRYALYWLLCCLCAVVALGMLWPQARINSSVLALLPDQSMGETPPALTNGFLNRLDQQLVWLVSPGAQDSPAAARRWVELLRQHPGLRNVKGAMEADQQTQWGQFLYQHRNGNLDAQTRQRLTQGIQPQWVLSQLFSAFSGVSGQELQHDPLMLVRGAQLAMAGQAASRLHLQQGWLVTRDEQGRNWYMVRAELAGSSFDMTRTHQLTTDLAQRAETLQRDYPQAQLLARGTLFYSDYASQQARHDIATLGSVTLFGVLLLILAVYRSLRPLLLCLLSIAVGAVAGTLAVLLCYGELHLMTLVMSLSIVGISADYTLYYLTERMVHGQTDTPLASLHKVRNALLLALFTTVIAYLLMMLAPFPGIRQLALFASCGLAASCLTVLFWHPLLCVGQPVRPVPFAIPLLQWLAAWRHRAPVYLGIPLAITAFSLFGFTRLQIDDNISQLQALPAAIHARAQQVSQLTGQDMEQKGFVVFGPSAQDTLQRLETFDHALAEAQQQGLISHYRRIPLNSLARQQADQQLLIRAQAPLQQMLSAAGVNGVQIDTALMPITAEDWLASPVSEGWRLLWLTLADGTSGVFVPVDGVRDSAALAALAHRQTGVAWVDRKASFDQLFAYYRTVLTLLLGVAVLVIAAGALLRQGWRQGLRSLIPTVLSLGCAMATLGVTGHSVNLFSLLALVLVLGIGINYTLFFSNPRGTPVTSLLAITLAMLTTLLTLGMLVFSATQAISSFGIVLCSGIFTAYLLAPLALPKRHRTPRTARQPDSQGIQP